MVSELLDDSTELVVRRISIDFEGGIVLGPSK